MSIHRSVLCCFTALCLLFGIVRAGDYPTDNATLAQGRTLFLEQCASCHALVQDGIGPPLGGVTKLLGERQLVQWIRDPAKVIASNDARAAALLRRYKVPMPSFAHLSATEVSAVLAYVDDQSAAQQLAPFV